MNNRPLHDDSHQEEPLTPVWRRFKSATPTWQEAMEPQILDSDHITVFGVPMHEEPDEPTGHAETIQEMIRQIRSLEARVLLLESLNKDKFFEQLTPAYVSDPIHTSPTIEG